MQENLLKLIPFALPKPWGGGHLDRLLGHTGPDHIGEYIIFTDLPQFPVKVWVGAKQLLLSECLSSLGLSSSDLPFMIKVLSTSAPISLQNHPSDADVVRLGLEGQGKFECWSILEADAGATAYLGLKIGENPEVLRTLSADNNPMSHFNAVPVSRGDVVKLNPGLIHSTAGRILFYEIQQRSDHTFRIYDFGRARELHLDEAISCLGDQRPEVQNFDKNLVTDKFSVAYHKLTSGAAFTRSGEKYSLFTWFGKPGRVRGKRQKYPMQWGDSVLVLNDEEITIEVNADIPLDGKASEGLPMIDMLFEAYI
jgi:mannose-6-phosphate isomerase